MSIMDEILAARKLENIIGDTIHAKTNNDFLLLQAFSVDSKYKGVRFLSLDGECLGIALQKPESKETRKAIEERYGAAKKFSPKLEGYFIPSSDKLDLRSDEKPVQDYKRYSITEEVHNLQVNEGRLFLYSIMDSEPGEVIYTSILLKISDGDVKCFANIIGYEIHEDYHELRESNYDSYFIVGDKCFFAHHNSVECKDIKTQESVWVSDLSIPSDIQYRSIYSEQLKLYKVSNGK